MKIILLVTSAFVSLLSFAAQADNGCTIVSQKTTYSSTELTTEIASVLNEKGYSINLSGTGVANSKNLELLLSQSTHEGNLTIKVSTMVQLKDISSDQSVEARSTDKYFDMTPSTRDENDKKSEEKFLLKAVKQLPTCADLK